ncbi:carbohydrate porin [Vibrio rumoiensis]|uniref:carbohydrate porin n=1 Tax=Vibrio rumoiensis TaxID=76258 RepID=UPI000B5D0013|nr:carbohydrate porin [Vibrio rumoiensis]
MKLSTLTLALAAATTLLPLAAQADDDFLFTGYARYGAGYSADDALYDGAMKNGINVIKTANSQYQATGRLGNEGNGFEFKLQKMFQQDDMQWDVAVMLDDGYDGNPTGISQAYAGGKGIFATQPDAYIWAGQRFNGREQIGVNDYFYLMNDGTGTGVDNLDLSFAKLDFSVVAGDKGRNGRYAVVTKLHDINLTDSQSLRFHFNYGFGNGSSTDADTGITSKVDDNNAYQVAAIHRISWSNGWNETAVRYSDGVRNGILWGNPADEGGSLGVFAYGAIDFTENVLMEYALSFEDNDLSTNAHGDEMWSQAVIRPGYRWNDRMSTWLELGYDQVDFDDSDKGTNSSWKATLSQNIGLGSFMYSRPMLRFYATYGQLDTDYATGSGAEQGTSDALTVGAMFEAWW